MASIICETFDINFVFEEIVKFISFIARIKSNLMIFLHSKLKNRNDTALNLNKSCYFLLNMNMRHYETYLDIVFHYRLAL